MRSHNGIPGVTTAAGARKKIAQALDVLATCEPLPIDAPISRDGHDTWAERLVASADTHTSVERRLFVGALTRALEKCDRRDRYLWLRCAVYGDTYQQAGQEFGLGRERVRQLVERANETIRARLIDWRPPGSRAVRRKPTASGI